MTDKFRTVGLLPLLACLLLAGCSSKMKVIRDGVSRDYLDKEYGNAVLDFAEMNESFLEYFRRNLRTATSESAVIPSAQKNSILKRLDSCQYEPNRFFAYFIRTSEPFSPEKLKLRFFITDAGGRSLLEDVFMLEDKTIVIGAHGTGGSITYQYIWLFKAKKPLDSKNVPRSDNPVRLVITFPNGESRVYLVNTAE